MASIEQLRELADLFQEPLKSLNERDAVARVMWSAFKADVGDEFSFLDCRRAADGLINSALALVERLLPGWDMALYFGNCMKVRWCCQIERCPDHASQYEGESDTPALAILRALVAALSAQADAD